MGKKKRLDILLIVTWAYPWLPLPCFGCCVLDGNTRGRRTQEKETDESKGKALRFTRMLWGGMKEGVPCWSGLWRTESPQEGGQDRWIKGGKVCPLDTDVSSVAVL